MRALDKITGVVRRFLSSSAEKLGGLATSIYLSLVFIMIGWRMPEFFNLPLNELGDFLAGVFGPLAVFWLVLGYYQQGKELKVSSQALVAQCVELASSTKQQYLALELSRSQATLAQEKHMIEMLQLEESVRPRVALEFTNAGITHMKGYIDFSYMVITSAAYSFEAFWEEGGAEYPVLEFGYLASGSSGKLQVSYDRPRRPTSFSVVVCCKNVRGRSYCYRFSVNESEEGNRFQVVAVPPPPTSLQSTA